MVVMIICEVGLNHMGSIQYASQYIKQIIKSKADGVLFHIREESFYKAHPELLLPDKFYSSAVKLLHRNDIKFGITLADPKRVSFCEKIGVDFYKIFSRDILDLSILNELKKTRKKIFVSTGISDLHEIRKFVNLLKDQKKQFTLIHTQLDNSIDKVNLLAIPMLQEKFRMSVAYGNHAANTNVLYLALSYKPSDLLFYVKGSKVKKHIDDIHAVKLDILDDLIADLKEIPRAIGGKTKLKMKANIK
jgi:sialic acid synthase SpsE